MAEQKLYTILSGLVDGADKEIKALSGAYIINSDYQSLLDRIEANISNLTT